MKQRGFSFFGLILLLVLVSVVVMLAIRIAPAYYDYFAIKEGIKQAINQPRVAQLGNTEVLKKIRTQLSINNIRMDDLGEDAISISRDEGVMTVELAYDVERELYANEFSSVSILMHFEATNEAPIR